MTEIYKDIKDLEGKYQVSNFGNVLSLNFHRSGKPKLMKQKENNNGYLLVGLRKNGKQKFFQIHRLVAETFLPNPNNLPCVNHKDEDKTNNFVGTQENDYKDGNLEWCKHDYNNKYGSRIQRAAKTNTNGKKSKKVLQFTKYGEFIREWPSTMECERNGFYNSHVSACCRGEQKTHKGYIWKYKE